MAKEHPPVAMMPLATARELAKVEAARWTQAHAVLALAASIEDQEVGWQRRVAAAERAGREAEAACEALRAALQTRVAEAEADALQRIEAAASGAQRVEEVAAQTRLDCQAKVDAAQDELIRIGRDQDAAREARAEYAGLLAEVQALRTERDELVAKLTR